jgi:hypothetical protein
MSIIGLSIDSVGVFKRSSVVPLPKDTNLLDQVCRRIDWGERAAPPVIVFVAVGELVCETGLPEVRGPVKGCPSLWWESSEGRGHGSD